MAVSSFGAAAGGLQQYEQIFTSSGTWTKPTGVKTCEVTILGGTISAGSTAHPTAAAGYWKGILDVSSESSVAVTVGGQGGTSSFGNFVATPGGNNPGSYYFPNKTGTGYFMSSDSAYTYDVWVGYQNQYAYTANGVFFLYGQNNGNRIFSTNNGASWSNANNFVNALGIGNTGQKFIYGNGVYMSFNTAYNSHGYIYYSTAGLSAWSYNSSYYTYDGAYGPAGFLFSSTNTGQWFKTTDGSSFTSVTPSGLNNSYLYRLQGTSEAYYAFGHNTSSTTAYRSTDGVNWTSFSLSSSLPYSLNANMFTSWNNKVYFLPGNNNLVTISGTTATNTAIAGGGGFHMPNSPWWVSSTNTFSHVENPTGGVSVNPSGYLLANGQYTNNILGITDGNAVLLSNTSYSYGNYFKVLSMLPGRVGPSYRTNGNGYSYTGTHGVMSQGIFGVNSSPYNEPIAGQGNEDGWGQGATPYYNSGTFGSGAASGSSGNSGVVRVRWWA